MRSSITTAPGVRMNFSKSGAGHAVGGKGYRVTKQVDRGPRTLSAPQADPSSVSASGRAVGRQSAPPPAPELKPAKPGRLAPKADKELYAALQSSDMAELERICQTHPFHALAAATMAGVLYLSRSENGRARELLEWVFDTAKDPATDPFLTEYVTMSFTLDVVPGATATLGLDRAAIGLALAELRQNAGDLAGAIDAVEQLEPTTFAALSLAELYCEAGRLGDAIELTDGITNTDDSTALLCVFRGIACRDEGRYDDAREAFKEALKSKQRDAAVRHRALFERARCYEMEGKPAMARKDLERIHAEDSAYENRGDAMELPLR